MATQLVFSLMSSTAKPAAFRASSTSSFRSVMMPLHRKIPAVFDVIRYLFCQSDDNVCHNVGSYQIVFLAAVRRLQFRIFQNIACFYMVTAPVDVVSVAVFISNLNSIGVNIHRVGFLCVQQQRSDGQDTAAAANIQHHIVFLHIFFDEFHAQLCGFVGACTGKYDRGQFSG